MKKFQKFKFVSVPPTQQSQAHTETDRQTDRQTDAGASERFRKWGGGSNLYEPYTTF